MLYITVQEYIFRKIRQYLAYNCTKQFCRNTLSLYKNVLVILPQTT